MTIPICVSAPGSIMLLGEHAVLHGRQALVCAINRRLRVSVTPLADDRIELQTELGTATGTLSAPPHRAELAFLCAVVARYQARLETGFRLVVTSEADARQGLGTSAAVVVAALAALETLATGAFPIPARLFDAALAVVQSVQGLGSGADLAASLYGGALVYRAQPRAVRPLRGAPPLTLVYCGYKTPTPEVVRQVETARKIRPRLFHDLFSVADLSVQDAANALESGNWTELGALLNLNQGLMEAFGVGTAELSAILYGLRARPGIQGAKISGAGLGDCVVAIGAAELTNVPGTPLAIAVEPDGVRREAPPP